MESPILRVLSVAVLVLGCGGSEKSRRGPQTAEEALEQARYQRPECETSGREERVFDTNGDGRNDIRQLFLNGVETCRETDPNWDGKMDFFRFMNERGVLERLDEDLDFDGHVDQVTFYEGGTIARRDLDTNFDDIMDTHEFYTSGVIVRAERDANLDGAIDYWEHYQGGRLARVQWDEDSDGQPDRTDDDPEGETAARRPPPAPGAGQGEGEGEGPEPEGPPPQEDG